MMLFFSLLSFFLVLVEEQERTSDHRPSSTCFLSFFPFFLLFSRHFYPRHGERSECYFVT